MEPAAQMLTGRSCRVEQRCDLMKRRAILGLMMLAMLGGCGRSETYRYKLTLSVDTPDGVKTAFSVVEVHYYAVGTRGGVKTKTKGEAVYLDLGPGRRPLIALLTRRLRHDLAPSTYQLSYDDRWGEDRPTQQLMSRVHGMVQPRGTEAFAEVAAFKHKRGPRPLNVSDLPDLVTFAEKTDPKSVLAVDPENLSDALGRSVTWRSMTIEVTDEPISKGIRQKLQPWLTPLRSYLSGQTTRSSNDLPSTLHGGNFIQE
jgi:hypothetical protein